MANLAFFYRISLSSLKRKPIFMLAWPTPEVGLILLLLEECCDRVGVKHPVERDRLFPPLSNVEAKI